MAPHASDDCQAATGPLAYLADLIDYTLAHVTKAQPGLRAEYYDDLNLTVPKLTRVDPKVEFVWGAGSPHPSIAPTTFSVRWSGRVKTGAAGTYTFYMISSDGARLWVNDQLIINNWTDHSQTENSGTVGLNALQLCTIRLEHYKNSSSAAGIKLLWSGPGQAKEVIPQSQLSYEGMDIQTLVDLFHQPFGELPGMCEAMHTPVAQVRICSEVLHRYFQARQVLAPNSPAANTLVQAEKAYRRSAHLSLLSQIGTSYEQLRLGLTGSPESRAILADRLGIQANRLEALFLDPDTVSAQALERLFGLADTRRDPLSRFTILGDSQQQLTRWQLDGVAWNKNTDPEGLLYVRLKKQPSVYQVLVYRHPSKSTAMLVASGSRNISAEGPIPLTAANNSGLTGSVQLNYAVDSEAIQLLVLPSLLAWRLERLRALWYEQDWATAQVLAGQPRLDPDLIGMGDLRAPPAPALINLWQERRTWIDTQLTMLQSSRESNRSLLEGLNAILKAALARSATEAMSVATLLQQADDEVTQGLDITPWLDQHDLNREAFLYLARIGRLVTANTQVLATEWADVYSILVQVQKRRQFATWRNQEQNANITLSPDFFQLPASEAAGVPTELPAWRTTATARREWQDILQTRLDQERTVIIALQEAIRATEDATLPLLRDALILASDAPGHDLESKARWISDRLLIDTQVAGSQRTTRASQAVETLQGLLYSLRTGQLSDTYPDLNLTAAAFDEEWQWIGSYATWRAAMGVFLYPENLLLPSLRQQQTPAFRALAGTIRASRRLTPNQARRAAKDYSEYYRDVCSLSLEAACLAETRVLTAAADMHKNLFYIFGRGGATSQVYWSAYDPQDGTGYAQSFWEAVPGVAKATRIIGALPYEISADERFIYLFVQSQTNGKPTLAFTRYDLERQLWNAELSALELPSDSGSFTIVAVQSMTESEPPQLFLRGGRVPGMYIRALDDTGSDWATPDAASSDQDTEPGDEWAPFRVSGYPSGSILKAALKTSNQPSKSFWLCYQKTNGHISVIKQNNLPTAPINAFSPLDLGVGTFLGAFQLTTLDEIFVFYLDTAKKPWYRRISTNSGVAQAATPGLQRVIPGYGKGAGNRRDVVYQASNGSYRCTFTKSSTDVLNETETTRVAPKLAGPFEITEQLPGMDVQVRRSQVQAAVNANKPIEASTINPESNLAYVAEAYYFTPLHLALQLQSAGHYIAALDWFRTIYDYRAPLAQRKIYFGLKLEESLPNSYQRGQNWLLDPLNPHAVAGGRKNTYTRFTLLALIDCLLDFADTEFTRDTAESIPRARTLYLTALDLLGLPEVQAAPSSLPPLSTSFGQFTIVANPFLAAVRLRAELNLFKLRHGRNIAGLERQLAPYAAAMEAATGMPGIGAGGQLALPDATGVKPTPYRFSVLIERAKTLVQLASQMEAVMLSALEKRDSELYTLLKARQDIQLTRAGVRLQDLRVQEAEDGVKLAELQRERSQLQFDYFAELLDKGTSVLELLSLAYLGSAAIAAAFVPGQQSSALSSAASIASSLASFERRRQEWEFQQTLAQQDLQIGAQQVRLAGDHVRIASQERTIAGMNAEHAEAVVDFIANKFTNAELFDWMSGILERVYAYFLQQATAVAKLAEHQLAFERQEPPPSFIHTDYWEAPSDGSVHENSDGRAPDRRGMTGSARLLQDIFQLDQYAFETNRRKLQLTKTLSLAHMAPAEFELFRRTGVLQFTTPMELFDRDFPGHYLRLIRRVRTSVIALIPPTLGIRATLSNTGVSRVVVGAPIFQPVVVNLPPQSVALSLPHDATGLFELDQQPEMLLPFESLGVDTAWEFRMPKAANRFDYNTITDVLLTIEYTALDSFDYRQQVIQALSSNLSADRPFSFRHQFSDQWYDLHNPGQATLPMTVRFNTTRADFAPNLDDLTIQHLLLYIVPASAQALAGPINVTLRFRPAAQPDSVDAPGGQATPIEGVISTRRGNASGWLDILGRPPIGEWELALQNTPEVRSLFEREAIADLLLVITYQGRTPAWTG